MALPLCYMCHKNVPETDSVLCKSCELEYPLCFNCGENMRSIPYKLCTQCYQTKYLKRRVPLATGNGISFCIIIILFCFHFSGREIGAVLEPLDSKKAEYKRAYEQFISTWVKYPPPPKPEAIYAITNKNLSDSFHKYVQELRGKDANSTTAYHFHGTKLQCNLLQTNAVCSNIACGICGISQKGFDPSLRGTNIPRFKRYGNGFYFAPNSSKCHDYTQGVEAIGLRAQLLCLVASGTRFETTKNHTDLSKPPQSCHSVFGVKGGVLNYEEVVVYESHAILPEFVIVYKKNGVHKIAN